MLQRGPHCGSSVVPAHASRTSAPSRRKAIRGPLTHRQDSLLSSIPRASHASGAPQTSPTRVAPPASPADSKHPSLPSHATPAYNSCRYCGPSAASGSLRGGRGPRALSPRSRPSARPPSQLMFQAPTYALSRQCHIMHCPSCRFALSYTPTAFKDQCPLQVCRRP